MKLYVYAYVYPYVYAHIYVCIRYSLTTSSNTISEIGFTILTFSAIGLCSFWHNSNQNGTIGLTGLIKVIKMKYKDYLKPKLNLYINILKQRFNNFVGRSKHNLIH